jgi:hypothetical protein
MIAHSARRLAAASLPGVLAAAVAGCGSISWDQTKVQNAIRDVLVKQAHVQVTAVRCPSNVKIAAGVVTDCQATLAGGDTVRFSATQTDGKGHIHVGPAEMIAVEVENQIHGALKKRGVTATATCPQHVPIVSGKTFVCSATDAHGQRARIGVTITDKNAGFRMRLLGP